MKRATIFKVVAPLIAITAAIACGSASTAYAERERGGERGISAARGGGGVAARSGGRDFGTRSGRSGGYAVRDRYYSGNRSHFSGSIWIGPGWGFWDPFYYPYYYPYPSYRYYPAPSVVVPQQPEEYITPDSQSEEEGGYWYFCRKPEGYYPYVERCPSGWMKVVPNVAPPDEDAEEDKEN